MANYNRIFAATIDSVADTTVNTTYATVRNSTTGTSTSATTVRPGQSLSGANYSIGQYFAVFDTSTLPSGNGTAALSVNCTIVNDAGDALEVREATSSASKIAGDNLSTFPLYSSLALPPIVGRNTFILSDITALSRVASLKLLVHSQNERLNVAPTLINRHTIQTADATGTTNDPYLDINFATWQFVGVSNEVAVATTAHALVTTGISGTLAAGDLLVACITSRIASATSVTLPAGGEWTLVAEQKNNNTLTTSSALPSGMMAYCVRGASNPNLTFTHPVAPSQAQGRIVAYRNVNTSSPKDTQTSFTTATAQTAVTGAGLTTTQIEDLIVAMACGGQEAAWSAFNATDPAGASGATVTTAPATTWSERADSLVTTGADGSLAIFDAVKLTAGATGNLTATASVSAGHVVIAGAFKITAGVTHRTMPAVTGATVLAGITTGVRAGRRMAAAADAVAVTHYAANLQHAYTLPVTQSSVVVTFSDANLVVTAAKQLTADTGAVTITGYATVLRRTPGLLAAKGTITLTGTDASLGYRRAYAMPALKGAVTVTFNDASLAVTHRLAASTGAIVLTGQAAALRHARVMPLAAGAVTLTGYPAALSRTGSYTLAASTGAVTLSVQAAALRRIYAMLAAPGGIVITGHDADLIYATAEAGYTLNALTGAIVATGQGASLGVARALPPDTKQPGVLRFGRRVVAIPHRW